MAHSIQANEGDVFMRVTLREAVAGLEMPFSACHATGGSRGDPENRLGGAAWATPGLSGFAGLYESSWTTRQGLDNDVGSFII